MSEDAATPTTEAPEDNRPPPACRERDLADNLALDDETEGSGL